MRKFICINEISDWNIKVGDLCSLHFNGLFFTIFTNYCVWTMSSHFLNEYFVDERIIKIKKISEIVKDNSKYTTKYLTNN